MRKYFILALTLIFITGIVSPAVLAGIENDPTFYIDSRLPDKDRAVLKNVMMSLDKEDRENVLFIDEDGWFTANRLELIEEFKRQNEGKFDKDGKLKKKEKSSTTYEKNKESEVTDENIVSIASTGYQHPSIQLPSANSGPYRRVMSKSGYSRLTANIYLPNKAAGEAYMNPNAGISCDKGYIYTGAVTDYGQIDMGLALNYEAGPYSWDETWGMFVHGHSHELEPAEYGNFKMGTTVFFKYYTPQDNQAALFVSGKDKYGNNIAKTLVVAVSSTKKFKSSGSGMKIKRVTSVGQTEGYENLTTGSYIKNAGWNDVKIGTTSGSEVLMNGTNTESFGGYKIENVLVDYTDQANEKVWVKCGTL